MTEVVLGASAEAEALEAFTFYAGRSSGLGAEFTTELERVLLLLSEHPSAGFPIQNGARRILLRRFPYYLIYRVEENRVLVLVVAHQSREPGYWQDRV